MIVLGGGGSCVFVLFDVVDCRASWWWRRAVRLVLVVWFGFSMYVEYT